MMIGLPHMQMPRSDQGLTLKDSSNCSAVMSSSGRKQSRVQKAHTTMGQKEKWGSTALAKEMMA